MAQLLLHGGRWMEGEGVSHDVQLLHAATARAGAEPDLAEPAAAQQRPRSGARPEGPGHLHRSALSTLVDALSAHIQLTVSRTASVCALQNPTAARGEQAAAAAVDLLQRDDAERSAALRGQRIR